MTARQWLSSSRERFNANFSVKYSNDAEGIMMQNSPPKGPRGLPKSWNVKFHWQQIKPSPVHITFRLSGSHISKAYILNSLLSGKCGVIAAGCLSQDLAFKDSLLFLCTLNNELKRFPFALNVPTNIIILEIYILFFIYWTFIWTFFSSSKKYKEIQCSRSLHLFMWFLRRRSYVTFWLNPNVPHKAFSPEPLGT